MVNAFGLEWCKDAPKSIGVANATAKILCKTHNEALSEFDAEAVKLSRFLTTNVWDDPLKSDTITLSGVLLEKWALKTCVNLGFIGALDPETHTRVIPDESLVRAVFCPGSPPEGTGLYFLHGKISNEAYQVGLSWKAIRNRASGDRIVGMSFVFNGFRFVVSLVPVRAGSRSFPPEAVHSPPCSLCAEHFIELWRHRGSCGYDSRSLKGKAIND